MNIQTVQDKKRGCGWRKEGGLYLMSDGLMMDCGKLPIPLETCKACGSGIKQGRGWTWLDGDSFIEEGECGINKDYQYITCLDCGLYKKPGRVGLLWVGEKYYPTPKDFIDEGWEMGVSKRISRIPRGFELGKTWVWLAHPKAIKDMREGEWVGEKKWIAGVFQAYRPTRIEYVVKGDESEEELTKLEKRGITLVQIERIGEGAELFNNGGEEDL